MSNSSEVLLRKTLCAILEAFEAPPNAIDLLDAGEIMAEDPFGWAQHFYTFVPMHPAFGLKLQVLFVLTGITMLLSIAILIFQWRSPSQETTRWFFRKQYHNQSKIPYIVPHPINLVVAASLLTSLHLLIYYTFVYNAWNSEKWGRLIRITSWFPSAWFTFYSAVWFSGFGSFYLTYMVPSQYTRRGSLTGAKRHASPVLVNGLCFGIPILCISSLLPLQVKQSDLMRTALRSTRGLASSLGPLSLAWKSASEPFNTVALANIHHTAEDVLSAKHAWEVFWSAELALWSIWSLLALIVAVPFCLVLVLSTHRRIRSMATSQTHNHWSNGQPNQKNSPPLSNPFPPSPSPGTSITEDSANSPTKSLFRESGVPNIIIGQPFCSSPASTIPPSAVQTPAAQEYTNSPFFSIRSSSSLTSGKSPSISEGSPSLVPILPHTGRAKQGRLGSAYSRHSFHSLRHMSHTAIFPSRVGGPDAKGKTHLDDLDKRFWHIAGEYATVLLVMVLICSFALFELISQSRMLNDCPRKVLSTVVVSYAYCCLVNIWLSYNLYRLWKDASSFQPSCRSNSTCSSSGGKRPSTDPVIFEEDYDLQEKRLSKSSGSGRVQFADQLPRARSFDETRTSDAVVRGFPGLRIEIITELTDQNQRRPSVTGSTLHSSFERRRSSYRAPSLDFVEALALAPPDLSSRSRNAR